PASSGTPSYNAGKRPTLGSQERIAGTVSHQPVFLHKKHPSTKGRLSRCSSQQQGRRLGLAAQGIRRIVMVDVSGDYKFRFRKRGGRHRLLSQNLQGELNKRLAIPLRKISNRCNQRCSRTS